MPDVTIQEMYYYCADGSQLKRQTQRLLVHTRTLLLAAYGNTMKQDIFFHILRFLHFSDNKNEPDKTDENMTGCGK
jgi:hypothetical protein